MKWIRRRNILEALAVWGLIGLVAYLTVGRVYGFAFNLPYTGLETLISNYAYPKPQIALEGIVAPKDPLDSWLTELGKAENCPESGIVDSNGLKSYGKLCFQERTFVSYSLALNEFPNAEPYELPNLMTGETEQRRLAKRMIKEDYNNWKHWECTVLGARSEKCAKLGIKGIGIGYPPHEKILAKTGN